MYSTTCTKGECGNTSDKKNHKIDHIAVSEAILPAVLRYGFFPFDEICDTDHRSGYVLWDTELIFGVEPDDLTSPERRKLILAYPDRVDKYKSYVMEKFKELNLLKSLSNLTNRAMKKESWTAATEEKYNKLDKLVTTIMKDREQQCMTKKKHNTPWSMALIDECYKLYY